MDICVCICKIQIPVRIQRTARNSAEQSQIFQPGEISPLGGGVGFRLPVSDKIDRDAILLQFLNDFNLGISSLGYIDSVRKPDYYPAGGEPGLIKVGYLSRALSTQAGFSKARGRS